MNKYCEVWQDKDFVCLFVCLDSFLRRIGNILAILRRLKIPSLLNISAIIYADIYTFPQANRATI